MPNEPRPHRRLAITERGRLVNGGSCNCAFCIEDDMQWLMHNSVGVQIGRLEDGRWFAQCNPGPIVGYSPYNWAEAVGVLRDGLEFPEQAPWFNPETPEGAPTCKVHGIMLDWDHDKLADFCPLCKGVPNAK